MMIMIVGGGLLGSYLAELMEEESEKVVLIEKDETKLDKIKKELKDAVIVGGDGCNPDVLKKAGILQADVVVAATGHDEDNLMICHLAKFEFGVAKVVSRINSPKNEWLYTKDMGVDAAVSGARMMASLIEEEAGISNFATILNLSEEKLSLVKSVVESGAEASHKQVKDLSLPSDYVIVVLVRDNKKVLIPKGNTTLLPGDEILGVVSEEHKREVQQKFKRIDQK